MEQVFFNVPLFKLEPIFKKWMRDVLLEPQFQKITDTVSFSEELLNVEEAAQFLKLSIPTIYSKVSRKELPVMKRGKRLYFSKSELFEYVKAGHMKTITDIDTEAERYLSNKKELNNKQK